MRQSVANSHWKLQKKRLQNIKLKYHLIQLQFRTTVKIYLTTLSTAFEPNLKRQIQQTNKLGRSTYI